MRNIAIHHSGGLGNDQFASTKHLTPQDISDYHKYKWNFPSEYITDENLRYAGYNVTYDRKTRIFTQHRAIGEETAAQKGHNHDTFSLHNTGNYNRKPIGAPNQPVDKMTDYIEKDIALFLHDLIDGNKRNLVVAPNTVLNFSIKRIYPHSFFSQTMCYGSYLAYNWAQGLVIKWKPVEETLGNLKERFALTQTILRLYTVIFDLLNKMRLQKQTLGSFEGRECDGLITIKK